MVSAAKLRGDQQRLAAAVPFSSWAGAITGIIIIIIIIIIIYKIIYYNN